MVGVHNLNNYHVESLALAVPYMYFYRLFFRFVYNIEEKKCL